MDLKHITLQVCEIAKITAGYLKAERKNFDREKVVEKNSHDYVSYVDKEAEKITVKALNALLPEAGFITEEDTVERTDTELNWIVDPLDGTTNYIHDYAPYCVSIALRKGNKLVSGVVYEVCRDECFYAWLGGNAYLNGNKIHVSGNKIENAFIGIDLPYNADAYKPVVLRLFDKLYGLAASIRIGGSAAISMCYVAAGRFDGWVEDFIKEWDYSAAVVIVREAGGKITDFSGNENVTGSHIIASNGVIHEELKKIINNI